MLRARTLGLVALGAAVAAVAINQVPGMAENPDAMSRGSRASSRASWPGSVSLARA